MKLPCFLIAFLIGSCTLSFSQYAPVPSYLTTQDFPDSVVNLSVADVNGAEITFREMIANHRAEKLVLDIWASWCRDCLVGYPKLEKLMDRTSAAGVEYVFLSIDEDEQKWKKAIGNYRMKGHHYRLLSGWKSPLSSYITLDWVPRYMVLNEKSRIVNPKAITAEELEKLLLPE